MKKFILFLFTILCFAGCIKYGPKEDSIKYKYVIHTIGGITDTLIVNQDVRPYFTNGSLNFEYDNIKYCYIDKIYKIPIK